MKNKKLSSVFLILLLVFLIGVQQSAAQPLRTPDQTGPGPTLIIEKSDVDAFTFVRPSRPFPGTNNFGPETATFNVTYNGFTPQAQAAFQYAVDIWSALITSNVTIYIDATWINLPGPTLGSASATSGWGNFTNAPQSNTWFPVAMAESIAGTDLNTPGDPDIVANFDSGSSWYLGTDGAPPGGQYDLVSVVLHEIGHGLGFFGSMRYDDGTPPNECSSGVGGHGCWENTFGWPYVYDLTTEDNSGTLLINTGTYPNPSAALGSALTSSAVYFDDTNANTANGGSRVRLYAPVSWNPGSSYSHLNENSYPFGDPNSLMTPQIGPAEAIHDPGQIVLCMFVDMGWTANCNPNAVWDGGGATEDWSEADNWSTDLVPVATTAVTFNSTSSKNALIDAAFAGNVGTIVVDAAYTGIITQSRTIIVTGAFTQTGGTYTTTGGTLVFDGGGTIYPWNMSGDHDLGDVQIGGANAAAVAAESDLDINGDLSFENNGSLNAGGNTISLAGNLRDSGLGFIPATSTLFLDGDTQSITKTVSATLLDEPFEEADGQTCCSSAFLPAGWLREQAVGLGYLGGDITPFSGDAGAAVRWDDSADAWLHTTGFTFYPGVTYNLSYNVRTLFAGTTHDYEVWLESDQASATATTLISSINNVGSTTYVNQADTFTVGTAGVYYLGFRSQQNVGAGYGVLDDILLTGSANLYNLQVGTTGSASSATPIAIDNDLMVDPGGVLDVGTQAISVEGTVTNNGTLRQTQDVDNAVVDFLHIQDSGATTTKYRGVTISTTASMDNLGAVSVSVRELNGGEYCTGTGAASPPYAGRCFDVSPTAPGTALLRLWALTSQVPGAIVTPTVYHDVNSNGTWAEITLDANDGTSGAYTFAEGTVTGFSPFLIANADSGLNTPTAVTLNQLQIDGTGPGAFTLVTGIMLLLCSAFGVWRWRRKSG